MEEVIIVSTINVFTCKMKSQSSMEGLSEGGLDPVEESHVVIHVVEAKNTCLVIQEHSHFERRFA